jgi:hypothetical protein
MSRFGQALLAPRSPTRSKTLSATLNPETPAIKDVTERVAAGAVKPIVAKRSQDGVFSVEEFWAITSCGTRGAGEANACFATLFSMKAASETQYARDLGDGSLQRAHLKTFNQMQLG